MKPEEMLKNTVSYFENLEKAKRLSVVVGLPKGSATSKIYGDGLNVVEVGTFHEYGQGNNPVRSFLRVPFKIKQPDIVKMMVSLFKGIAEKGKDAESQIELAGVHLENISKEAFTSKGFGSWQDIRPATKAAKKSSGILIDTGILRGSITSEVRGQ